MDEARRFLRYVTPGLVFVGQAFFLLFIIDREWTIKRLLTLKDSGAGFAAVLFLASGGLGYVFSVFHHWFHHTVQHKWLSAINHTKLVEELFKADLLNVRKLHEGVADKVTRTKFDRRTAWVIVTAVWKESLRNDSPIQSADACATGLTDIMHSAGAARVGAIFALAALVWLAFWPVPGFSGPNSTFESRFAAIVVGVVLIGLHHGNYLRTGTLAERFIHEVLSDTLWARKNLPTWSTDTFVEVRSAKKSVRHS